MAGHDKDIPAEKLLFDAADQLRGSVESRRVQAPRSRPGLPQVRLATRSSAARAAARGRDSRDPDSDDYIEDAEERAEVARGPRRVRRPRTSSGSRRRRAGTRCWRRARSRTSACSSTGRWTRSSRRTTQLRGVLPRIYAARSARRRRSSGELVLDRSPRSASATTPSRRATSSAASTSTSSRSSPAPRATAAASSTRPANVVRLLVEMLAALRGPHPRPGLRLVRPVHPVGRLHQGARRADPTRSPSTARSSTRPPGGSAG